MRRLLLAAPLLLATPANADGINSIFRGIEEIIASHQHLQYYGGPGPEQYDQGPGPNERGPQPPPQEIMGPEMPRHIVQWLEKQGETSALIVGRRDQDCANANQPTFYGGWGVILKHKGKEPGQFTAVSGVVCVDQRGPKLTTDK